MRARTGLLTTLRPLVYAGGGGGWNPSSLLLDYGDMENSSLLFEDSAETTLATLTNPVGGWRGHNGYLSLRQSNTPSKPALASDGVDFTPAGTNRALRAYLVSNGSNYTSEESGQFTFFLCVRATNTFTKFGHDIASGLTSNINSGPNNRNTTQFNVYLRNSSQFIAVASNPTTVVRTVAVRQGADLASSALYWNGAKYAASAYGTSSGQSYLHMLSGSTAGTFAPVCAWGYVASALADDDILAVNEYFDTLYGA